MHVIVLFVFVHLERIKSIGALLTMVDEALAVSVGGEHQHVPRIKVEKKETYDSRECSGDLGL